MRLARAIAGGYDEAVGFHLKFDLPVEVEIPEKAIVIIARRQEAGHDQPPLATNVADAGERVEMPPDDAEVFLMAADAVLHGHRVAEDVGKGDIPVDDLASAVSPHFTGLSEPPEFGIDAI